MIRANFLSPEDRADLIDLARNGSAAHRLARRANALVLLDDGWSCENVARALLLDDDTIRGWHGLFVAEGLDTVAALGHRGLGLIVVAAVLASPFLLSFLISLLSYVPHFPFLGIFFAELTFEKVLPVM